MGRVAGRITAAAVVTLGVLFGLHVFPLNGRTMVPIAGLVIVMFLVLGSTATTVVIALGLVRRLFTPGPPATAPAHPGRPLKPRTCAPPALSAPDRRGPAARQPGPRPDTSHTRC